MAATSTLTAHQPDGTAPAPAPATQPGTAAALGGRHRAPGTARRTNRGPGRHRAEAASRLRPVLRAAVVVTLGAVTLPLAAGQAAADSGAGVASAPQPTIVIVQPPVIATKPYPPVVVDVPPDVLTAAPAEPAPAGSSTTSPTATPTATPTPSASPTASASASGTPGSAPNASGGVRVGGGRAAAGPGGGSTGAGSVATRKAGPGGVAAGSNLTGSGATSGPPAGTPAAATSRNLPLTLGVSAALLLGILLTASAGFRLLGRRRAELAAA